MPSSQVMEDTVTPCPSFFLFNDSRQSTEARTSPCRGRRTELSKSSERIEEYIVADSERMIEHLAGTPGRSGRAELGRTVSPADSESQTHDGHRPGLFLFGTTLSRVIPALVGARFGRTSHFSWQVASSAVFYAFHAVRAARGKLRRSPSR